METKIILIILIVYYLFFNKISENFSSYHDCLSTVAGRMLWQKESIDQAIISAQGQNKCTNNQDKKNTYNYITSCETNHDCNRFLNDTKAANITPNNNSAKSWYDLCIKIPK